MPIQCKNLSMCNFIHPEPFGVAVLTVGVMHCYIATVPLSQKLLHSCYRNAVESKEAADS